MATAALGSTARTNQLLSEASKQTGIKAPTFTESPGPITTQNRAIGGATVERNADGSTYLNNYVSTNPLDSATGSRPRSQERVASELAGLAAPTQPIVPTTPDTSKPAVPTQVTNNLGVQSGIPGMANLVGTEAQQATQAIDQLKQKYGSALTNLNQSGVASPSSAGAGSAGVSTAIGMQPGSQVESPSIIGGIMETDANFDSILTDYDEFFNPNNQRVSLVEEYSKLSKSLGIDALNAELIDAKRIIEGTEDDIRSEITSVGGLATDSQVQAMGNARNKSLIKNYNYLLDSKNNAMTQLNTMMNLSIQDRQFAEAEFDRKLNFSFKVAEFKQKATDNARSTYMSLGQQMGWDTLLSSVTPYEQGVIGKTLGLDVNGLNNLALRSKQDRALSLEEGQLGLDLKREQIKTEQAQRSNIYSQIEERSRPSTGTTLDGEPQSTAQATANGYADRLGQADLTIASLGGQFTNIGSIGGMLPNIFQSAERQQYEQAKKNFITAVLRRESGASIAPSEFSTAEKQYFPQPGDKEGTIKQKADNRNTVINNFYREANINRPVAPGQVIESNGKKYIVGTDGVTLIPQ